MVLHGGFGVLDGYFNRFVRRGDADCRVFTFVAALEVGFDVYDLGFALRCFADLAVLILGYDPHGADGGDEDVSKF